MVAASRWNGGAFGIATAALIAVYLATASYLTLHQATYSGGSRIEASSPASVAELKRLSDSELAEKRDDTNASFARDPLAATTVIALSRLADVEGNSEASERLKLIASQMMPRDARVQAEAMSILLERRDFDQVMTRLDGLIRSRPSEAGNFFLLAAEMSTDPDGSMAVARMLATTPPWRAKLLSFLLTKQQTPDIVLGLVDNVRGLGKPVADSELRTLIDYYLKAGDIDQAYGVWLSSLEEDELNDVREVYDGGFRHPIRNLRFDWTVKDGSNLTYRLFPRNTASSDQTLQLDFQSFTGSIANLSQILRLRPGRYRLSGEARFDGFTSPTGVVFRVYCGLGAPAKLLDETAPLPQSSQWIGFDKTFVVPNADCGNQLLRLESKTKLLSTQITTGMLAIDSVKIENLPVLAP